MCKDVYESFTRWVVGGVVVECGLCPTVSSV